MGCVGKHSVVGGFLSAFVLALYAARDGDLHGAGENRRHPPGSTGVFANLMVRFSGMQSWLIGAFAGLVAAMTGQAADRLSGRGR